MISTTELKKLPVEDLIALMADKSQAPHHLDQIFCEFHRRFINYGFKVARRSIETKAIFDQYECTVIVHNCFMAINDRASRFTPAAEGKSETEKVNRVLGWISKIIRNGVTQYVINNDKLKNKTIFTENIEDYLQAVCEIADETVEDSPPNEFRILLDKAIAQLRPEHFEIMATYLCWEDENGDIPPDILARLNSTYHLPPKYAGKITNRTIERLFKILEPSDKDTTDEVETAKSRREKIRGIIKKIPPYDWTDFPGNTGTS